MKHGDTIFLVSKNTGFECLYSYAHVAVDLDALHVITLDDSGDVRSCKDQICDFCQSNHIKLSVVENNHDFISKVNELAIHNIFICGWYWMLPSELIQKVNGNVYGIHHSLLPKYRGFSPLVWAMIQGDDVVGSSLFRIEDGVDTGDIYHQWTVYAVNKDIREVLCEIDSKIRSDFGSLYVRLIAGQLVPREQAGKDISYCARRNAEAGKIDWRNTSANIVAFIRAQVDPYPGAFFSIEDKNYIVDKVEIYPHKVFGRPGQVVLYEDGKPIICCSENKAVKILKIRHVENPATIFKTLDCVLC